MPLVAELAGKNAIITGSSRGIGRAIAVAFAAAGAQVCVHYCNEAGEADKTLAMLSGGGHALVQANIGNPADCQRLFDEALVAFDKIDILVNNAGIYENLPIAGASYKEWQDRWNTMLSTNLLGSANLSFLCGRHFLSNNGGKIINVASRSAFRGEPSAAHYAASKAGQVMLTRSLARELGPRGIQAYAIAPGWVETAMTRTDLEGDAGIVAEIPVGRVASVEDVANVALFLASDKANYLNGVTIDVNGGSYFH